MSQLELLLHTAGSLKQSKLLQVFSATVHPDLEPGLLHFSLH